MKPLRDGISPNHFMKQDAGKTGRRPLEKFTAFGFIASEADLARWK
jgi:hypothetical protein